MVFSGYNDLLIIMLIQVSEVNHPNGKWLDMIINVNKQFVKKGWEFRLVLVKIDNIS